MLFLGLYSCVISLSEDSELYKLIRKSAKEWKFFLKLSDAEVEKSVLDKVENVKKVMTAESGIMPSVSNTDAKKLLDCCSRSIKKGKWVAELVIHKVFCNYSLRGLWYDSFIVIKKYG